MRFSGVAKREYLGLRGAVSHPFGLGLKGRISIDPPQI